MNQSTEPDSRDEISRAARWGLILLPLLIAVVVGWIRWPESQPDPLDVTSAGPIYTTIGELATASDLIVIGTIDATDPGRTVSDPTNPDVGITTTLYRTNIERTIKGTAVDAVIVEHETALADGTPITINGTPPPAIGQRTVLFLIAGRREDFPHYVVINNQGRYLADGNRLTPIGSDALSQTLSQLTTTELATALDAED